MSGHCVTQKIGTHLVVNQGSERQIVKKICEVLPHIGIAVLPKTLIVEAIAATPKAAISEVALIRSGATTRSQRSYDKHLHLRDLSALVIAAEDGYSLSIADFQSNQEGDCFH